MRPPNEVRNFVHKRIIGAVGGFLTGGVTGAIGGAVRGGRSGGQPSQLSVSGGRRGFAAQGPCRPGNERNSRGICSPKKRGIIGAAQRFVPGGASGLIEGPRFGGGAGGPYLPSVDMREVRECLPGDVLGRDGFCYAKGSISNKEREWPRGRRPLGTPGEMAALAKAAAFGRRMETTVKRMQKIGVLKKPSKRSFPRPRQPLRLPPGGPSIINVE